MAIPGYDSGDVAEFALERAGARVAVVAGVVPDEFGLERSVRDPPADALAEPIDLVGHDGLRAVEAFRISLVYDPSALPPGASPTDVGIAVETSVASPTQRADGDSAEQSRGNSPSSRPLEDEVFQDSAARSSGARRERSEGLDEANGEAVSGQSPREEAVDDGWEHLESTVDLEETTVTAILNDRPPGSTVVAVYDGDDGGGGDE